MLPTEMNRKTVFSILLSLSLFLALSLHGSAQVVRIRRVTKPVPRAPALWREPTDIATRNLLLGAGDEKMKPDLSRVTFIEVQKGGYSKKYRVRDGAGNVWIAKIGQEAQSETASNRFVWAVGYESEITYLVPSLTIEGKGTFENVRLEARPKEVKRTGNWQWDSNPFVGTAEFQGLKIMMLLINNWDIKDENNQILVSRTGDEVQTSYIISDLGGSLGKTGGIISRSRNKPSDFVKSDFIDGIKGERIDFHYGGKDKRLFDNITIHDVVWLSGWLTRLSDEQIKDAFRAANYSPREVDELSSAMRERIDELARISGQPSARP